MRTINITHDSSYARHCICTIRENHDDAINVLFSLQDMKVQSKIDIIDIFVQQQKFSFNMFDFLLFLQFLKTNNDSSLF